MAGIYIERKDTASVLSMAFMGASALIRLIYFILVPCDTAKLVFQFFLPLAAAVLFEIFMIFYGGRRFYLTCIPVAMGICFFVIKSLGFKDTLHTVLCILLYTAVAVLYSLTATGVIKTKLLCMLVFGLPFLYHLFVEDTQKYVFAQPPVPFEGWLPEISVLLIMASLFFLTLAMKKQNKETSV